METRDLIVVGAGPAGLSAGHCASQNGLQTLILEQKIAGGLAAEIPHIDNYPGCDRGARGSALAEAMVRRCTGAGAEIRDMEKAVELDLEGEWKGIKTTRAEYAARAVIIASGTHHGLLGIPGEKEFYGKGVSYCAVCDGMFFRGKEIAVIGGARPAVCMALYLADIGCGVRLVHPSEVVQADPELIDSLQEKEIQVLGGRELLEIRGDKRVRSVLLRRPEGGETEEVAVEGVFFKLVDVPSNQIAADAGLDVDEHGYLLVDDRQRGCIPGVFAAGDVTASPAKMVGPAVKQGLIAATEAYIYLKHSR
jgi:thioredoxin reductase (NADPH)